MDKWLLGVAVNFMLRQIAKFGTATDWQKVKADLDARLPTLVYFQWLVPTVTDIVNQAIDVVAHLLQDAADLQAVSDKLVAGDVLGALVVLKDALVKILVPTNVVHLALADALDSHIAMCKAA